MKSTPEPKGCATCPGAVRYRWREPGNPRRSPGPPRVGSSDDAHRPRRRASSTPDRLHVTGSTDRRPASGSRGTRDGSSARCPGDLEVQNESARMTSSIESRGPDVKPKRGGHPGSLEQWLLDGDPSIRWQVMRDVTGAPAEAVAGARS